MYYFFYLEIALCSETDMNIYGYQNISHIPTSVIIEIFEIDITEDPFIIEGYLLDKKMYSKNKEYIDKEIGVLNFDIFEYSLRQYSTKDFNEVRKLFKEHLIE